MTKNFIISFFLAATLLSPGVAFGGPMNFGNTPGPMNGDEPSVTWQKTLAAIIARYGAPNVAVAQVAAASPATPVAARPGRRQLVVRNLDATVTIYVGSDAAVNASTGFPLKPGDAPLTLETTGALFFFAASGSPAVAVLEVYSPLP